MAGTDHQWFWNGEGQGKKKRSPSGALEGTDVLSMLGKTGLGQDLRGLWTWGSGVPGRGWLQLVFPSLPAYANGLP